VALHEAAYRLWLEQRDIPIEDQKMVNLAFQVALDLTDRVAAAQGLFLVDIL
jgi:hypothetical protein